MSKNTEDALKERIKELTCLYEVSSIIVNADVEFIESTFTAIAFSLKKAFKHSKKTEIRIQTENFKVATCVLKENTVKMTSEIKLFNETKGYLEAHLDASKFKEVDFLKEEQWLMDNISLKLGGFLESLEIKKNEASLKRQMEHTDRLRILGEITAGIAHELNTPLANILGFSELLKDDLENEGKTTNDVDKIIENTIFSREIVKKLMFFACEIPQEKKQINIVPNINSAINLLDASFRKKEVKCHVKIEADDIWLKVDPVQLTQIIFNLLMNAIFFSPKNGWVEVHVSQSETDIIIKIKDEGQGVNPKDLDKIFQPFFTTKSIGDGAGLGLSVVHGIVVSHKGTITAKNNLNKGVTFTVTLPKD
ncbi:HAMP domain-containing sensor histidine kinase [Tamlana sp. 2_MG-2023]|uniref:sensor histidine kinase n=1 Tax=unclassified Tamlana TaxID=2614803 RepID=UPI0026E474FF|nr:MULTISPECIES: HAMP domain-containing sensor histidine kinase [unclassified Tamlana]MDO6759248.1 HAMP domain-containing sensor histidine kinase [Tamlana sp. 2_MG-2023]MDO6790613.1 HAMP domain-containing sensor histidine kinase [Tamlana sp. 1_MG-2023]